MSTRANIVVYLGDSRVYLYRHCDGYLAECGADLLTHLRLSDGDGAEFLRAVCSQMYEKQSYQPAAKPVFEFTNGLHGDIEHAYFIRFEARSCGEPVIRHAARPSLRIAPDVPQSVWAKSGKEVSLTEFAEAINQDRRESNVRIKKLKAEQPQAYADCGEYEMV